MKRIILITILHVSTEFQPNDPNQVRLSTVSVNDIIPYFEITVFFYKGLKLKVSGIKKTIDIRIIWYIKHRSLVGPNNLCKQTSLFGCLSLFWFSMTSAFVLFGHSSLYNDITVNEILKTSIIVKKNQNFLCKYFNEYANHDQITSQKIRQNDYSFS